MTTLARKLRLSRLAGLCVLTLGALLVAGTQEAKADYTYGSSSSYSWSSPATYGSIVGPWRCSNALGGAP